MDVFIIVAMLSFKVGVRKLMFPVEERIISVDVSCLADISAP